MVLGEFGLRSAITLVTGHKNVGVGIVSVFGNFKPHVVDEDTAGVPDRCDYKAGATLSAVVLCASVPPDIAKTSPL